MDVQEDQTLAEGYKLKLNSYDLGVDIELADAVQRLRFEHPEVKVVVVTSLKPRIFCAGANIYMLGTSSHAFKVNFASSRMKRAAPSKTPRTIQNSDTSRP
jgi:benzoyl-CoA-dihydrodiol lyase